MRYGLVMLLHYYVDEQYLPVIFKSVEELEKNDYYVMMGAAWLIAEVIVKYYEEGVRFLKKGSLPNITHNKAIQKACESFRVKAEEKAYLKSLRRL